MVSCDVFLALNDHLIDSDIFEHWLNGYSATETVKYLNTQRLVDESLSWADTDCITANVNEQFLLFSIIEKGMENPALFRSLNTLQLSSDVLCKLTERYYEIDEDLMRELIGKKLSTKTRKDIEDISEKSKKGRRLFENFRRIYKTAEDFRRGTSLFSGIRDVFLLSETLASRYAAAVFLASNRFETQKRCLNSLTSADFLSMGNLMLTTWAVQEDENAIIVSARNDSECSLDLSVDKEFLQELKDLKIVDTRDNFESVKKAVQTAFAASAFSVKITGSLVSAFLKTLMSIIDIATDLNRLRDLKDFFVDVMEQVIVPFLAPTSLPVSDVETALSALDRAIKDVPAFAGVISLWNRFFQVTSECILIMYEKSP